MSELIRDPRILDEIQRRVLWLAVRMVDYANRERPEPQSMKVGGHQASSASMVTMLTALWFGFLRAEDRVSVKPHASPVLHAIHYLLGSLDGSYLTRLREFGGLQAYPSSTKDPYPIDFSTGSVGLGAAAPLFGAVTARYVRDHTGHPQAGRFISTLGDAELDEGNVWEAIADPSTSGLEDVIWVVDLNRQSLDRVVPGIKARRFESMFAENGWCVLEAKYGRRLQALFECPGGAALRDHLDNMSNENYQALFSIVDEDALRERFTDGAPDDVRTLLRRVPDGQLASTIGDLGGHDFGELFRCLDAADRSTRPSIIFAYTVKGWGLPFAGDPLNHAALLSEHQIDRLRAELEVPADDEWARFANGTECGAVCASTAHRLERSRVQTVATPPVPAALGLSAVTSTSTQAAFGRALRALSREPVGEHVVSSAPDVTVSTNLAGWVNAVGVYSPQMHESADDVDRSIAWSQSPEGRHIELGISEMNLFLLLGQLGLAGRTLGQPLVPIGTVYDPFVLRGLDAFVYSLYCGSSFIVVGTPSGVTLSYEGGAHQSIITPSVGTELPGLTFIEPAYVTAFDWLFCDAVAATLDPRRPGSHYFRLSTRPVDQAPFEAVRAAPRR